MQTIDRPDLLGPLYLHNNHRVERQAEIEEAISAWTKKRTVEDAEKIMMDAGVPVGRVNSVAEIVEGEQMKARGAVEDVWVGGGEGWNVKMPKVFPVLEGYEVKTRWAGPDLGQHTDEVLSGDLGLEENELMKLRNEGVIG
jgi:crotonobetainyl-CoA:carnitine CoA-transferase CaiB-like acyl-CoA transferase